MSDSEYNLMNQMPISECYLSKFNIQPHALSQANSIHTQSQIGISTQKDISNSGAYFTRNTCNWYTIEDLYTSKYKYTIIIIIINLFSYTLYP